MSGDRDSIVDFERASAARDTQDYDLRLYVVGMTPRSRAAIETLTRITSAYLAGRFKIEIIDILQRPECAAADSLVVAPTLVKRLPPPQRKLIGDLSNEEVLLRALNIRSH